MKSIASAVAGYGHPQKGRGAEKASLDFQLRRLTPEMSHPSEYYAAAVELLLPLYPWYDAPELDDESIRRKLRFLMNFKLVPDSSPGFPFSTQCRNTVEAVELYGPLILDLAFERIKFYLDDDLSRLDVLERLEMNLIDIWKTHIKEEPHPIEKIITGRHRIIFGGSLVNSLVERFFNQEYQDACASQWDTCPSKPGIGFSDESARLFYMRSRGIDKISSDVSGWDFSVDEKLLDYGFRIRKRRCRNPSPRWERAMNNVCFSVHDALVAFTGGEVVHIRGGIQKSGSFMTASLNSDSRNVLAVAVDIRCGVPIGKINIAGYAAMGDDLIQPDYGLGDDVLVGCYRDWGFRVTDVARVKANEPFEFCSHLFHEYGAELLSSARTLFRLLGQTPSIEFLMQFCYECRHNRNLVSLLTVLFASGWDVELPDHAIGLNVRAPSLQGKANMKKQPKQKVNKLAESANTPANARRVGMEVMNAMPTKALQNQFQTIMDPLTLQDVSIAEYLLTLGDPWVEDPAGVPILIGGATLRTLKIQQLFEVQAIANSSGFAMVAVDCDGWVVTSAGTRSCYASYSGGAQGSPIWYTNASYAGVFTPTAGSTTGTAGLLAVPLNLLDGQVTSETDVRLVAAGLEVFPDASANTSQGKLAVVAITKPSDSAANGSLVSTTYAILSSQPQDIVSFKSRPVSGWRSGHASRVVAIPNDDNNFEMWKPPAVGGGIYGYPQLAAIASGFAANQTFTAKVVLDYEITIGKTYVTGVAAQPVFGADASEVFSAVSHMPGPATSGPIGGFSGSGMKGFTNHLAVTRPAKLSHVGALAGASTGGAGGTFSNLFSQGLKWVADKGMGMVKGIVKNIPYVGPIASMLWE